MANELDLSAFDEDDNKPAAALDLSAFDEAPEVAAAPEAPADDVGSATRGLMGASLGGGVGYGAAKGIGKAADVGMSIIGDLSGDDIQKISDNRDVYNNLPKNPLESMLEQFRGLGDKNREFAFDRAGQARASLEGKAPIPVNEFYQTLAKPAENPKYSSELAPDKAHALLGDELDKMYPTLEDKQLAQSSIDNDLANIDNELNTPYENPRAELNQAVKEAKYENRMGQIEPKLMSSAESVDTLDEAGDEFKGKKEARQLQRMNEKIEKLAIKAEKKPSAANALENIQKRKEDFLYNQANAKDKTSTVRGERDTKQFTAAENRKSQLELNKIIDDEKAVQLKVLEEMRKKEKLLSDKKALEEKRAKLEKKVERTLNKAADKADSNLQNIKQAPAEIRGVSPFLENRVLGEDYGNTLENAIKDVRNSESIDPVRLDQKLQEIRNDVPDGKMDTVGKFNAELATSVKDDLQGRFPEYRAGMKDSAEAINTENIWEKLGIKFDKDLKQSLDNGTMNDGRTVLEDSGKSRLNQILLNAGTPKLKTEHGYLEEVLKAAEKNGQLQAPVADTLKQAEMSAMKDDVARLRKGKDLNAFDINSAAQMDYSRVPGMASKLGGTKLQELYAMYKDSKAAKLAKGLGTAGLTGFGAIAGGMAAADAAEAGEISPTQATAATLAEAVNPIPLTDSIEAVKGGNEAYNDSLAAGDSEALANLKGAGGATAGFVKPLTQTLGNVVPAVDQTLESGFKALNTHGFEQSNAARNRMEQNMKPKAFNEDFKTFVEQDQNSVAELAQYFKNESSTQAFVGPLEKAAQSDDRTRSAVLFGLYQQPAFRLALKKKN